MNANVSSVSNFPAETFDRGALRRELEGNDAVAHCARLYGNAGDPTSMRVCYLLRHRPGLSVSQLADLAGVSVSAMSRCLRKLGHNEVVSGRREGKIVRYALEDNDFTRTLVSQLGM